MTEPIIQDDRGKPICNLSVSMNILGSDTLNILTCQFKDQSRYTITFFNNCFM